MNSIRRNDKANERQMQEAMKEARLEKAMDHRREREARTGKRAYNGRRFISLEEASRRGYLASGNASQGKPEWWSAGNPDGVFAGGREPMPWTVDQRREYQAAWRARNPTYQQN